jgi:tRNA ligase
MVSSKHSLGTTVVPKDEVEVVDTIRKEVKPTVSHASPASNIKNTPKPQEPKQVARNKPDDSDGEKSLSKNALKKQEKAERAKAKKEADNLAKAAAEEETARQKETAQQRRDDHDFAPHAEMGRRWVKVTLDKAGKTEEELASVLWEKNMTAVTEVSTQVRGHLHEMELIEMLLICQLCDDSFEEHVLPTPEHLTGLHLHGLNLNVPHFETLDPSTVATFARQWGFIETPSVQLSSLDEVRTYTDKIAKEGSWNGEAIEGFVVRCRVKEVPSKGNKREDGEPPYPPGSPFFFKIKFEEPYLMYRQWREITRQMLPLLRPECKGRTDRKAFPWTQMQAKLKRPESAVYADWCADRMIKEPELFDNYDKGVVKVRERFLEWTAGDGRKKWDAARAKSGLSESGGGSRGGVGDKKIKTMIVPVAAPGCGKTLLGLGLSRLYGFGHTQSDDVTTKRTAAGFLKNIETLLKKEDVVYCDR